MPEAARITDPIGHVSIWARLARVALRVGSALVEGLAVAALITLAVGGSVLTMGCGAIIAGGLIAGFIGSATGYSAWKEKKISELTEDIGSPDITGMLSVLGSANVLINNLFAARAVTDAAVCSKHSGPPILVAEGSDSVWINTFPATRKGDKVQCSAKITDGSKNVFIGGNKTAYLEIADDKLWWETVLEIGIGLAMGRGGFPGRIACMGLGMLAGMVGDQLGKGFRSLIGYPVNPATGGKILLGESDTDFILPGPMQIEWKRRYSSNDNRTNGMLGLGWSLPYSVELQIFDVGSNKESIIYIDEQGRKIDLPSIKRGSSLYNTAEQFTISCTPGGHYEIKTTNNIYYQFGALNPKTIGDQTLRLARMRDLNSNWLAFRYDDLGRLVNIADSINRLLRIDYADSSFRASAVHLERAASGETPATLVRYKYADGARDASGGVTQVIDRTNNIVRTFEYADGLMVRQQFADGFACFYRWQSAAQANGPDGDRRVLRHWTNDGESYDLIYQLKATGGNTVAVDQLGRRFTWNWDTRYNLTGFTDPLDRTWIAEWSSICQLIKVRNPDGDEISFQHNEHGLPTSQTNGIGQTSQTLWNDRFNLPIKVTQPDGEVYQYEYDDRGNNTAAIDPLLNTTRYAYDAAGCLVRIVDAKGGTKTLSWNERAQLESFADCSNKITRYEYDNIGNLKSITDAAGHVTKLTHDVLGRLVAVAQPDGANLTYQYDAAGRLVGSTDALSRSTRFSLDLRGRLISRTDAAGRTIVLNYDAGQRLSMLTNENGERYQFVYDASDRIIEELRVDGTRHEIEYNGNGLPISVTQHPGIGDGTIDAEASESSSSASSSTTFRTTLVRDAAGRLTERHTLTHRYQYLYDSVDNLVESIKFAAVDPTAVDNTSAKLTLNPLHRTLFKYDRLGSLTEETSIDVLTGETHTLSHEHDALGNRTQTVLPAAATLDLQPQVVNTTRALNYLYYGSGHLHQINLSQTTLDTNNRLEAQVASSHQLIADIERDDLHREIQRTQGGLTTRFALDPLGRKQGIWTQHSGLRTNAFTTNDAKWQQALQNPVISRIDGLMKSYSYDLTGELRNVQHSINGRTQHRYDPVGRIQETLHAARATQVGGSNPIQQSNTTQNESFGYDPAGNLLDEVAGRAPNVTQGQNQGYIRDNLVRVFEDKRYAYDGHGRLIQKLSGKHTTQVFQWDDEHRLTAIITTRRPNTAQALTQTVRFDYDALGRRVAKHDDFGSTRFIWEGMRLIEERRTDRSGKKSANVVTYVYEPGSYVPLARIDSTEQPTNVDRSESSDDIAMSSPVSARTDNSAANISRPELAEGNWAALEQGKLDVEKRDINATRRANIYYFHTNQIGLPEELSDGEGNIRWRATYKTWGSTVSESWETVALNAEPLDASAYAQQTQLLQVQQNLRFQGQYRDEESGLHYNTFRFYDPDIGRFISPDPIGLRGGLNLQIYGSNPISLLDPLGLTAETAPGYSVYQIYENEAARAANKPYYVGITEDGRFDTRRGEHSDSGRLPKGAIMERVETGKTYGEARGIEQARIEKFGTKTGTIGADMSKATTAAERGNRINSFDIDSPHRVEARQTYFNNARSAALNKLNGKC
jgi:RHS repeat-associated protein